MNFIYDRLPRLNPNNIYTDSDIARGVDCTVFQIFLGDGQIFGVPITKIEKLARRNMFMGSITCFNGF